MIWMSAGMAQTVIPDARDGRIGGQLLFYFDMANYDMGYITITNLGGATIPVHMQLFGPEGESAAVGAAANGGDALFAGTSRAIKEMSRNPVMLTTGCTVIYDLRRFLLPNGLTVDLAGNKGFLIVTPVSTSPGNPAVPYNHLAGNSVHVSTARQNSFGLNAVARLAVDASGNPLPDQAGVLDGQARRFQLIQPARLVHDGFYALDTVSDSRVILISFADSYSQSGYLVVCGSITINGVAGSADCNRKTLPAQSFSCLTDQNMGGLLGAHYDSFRLAPGFLDLNTTYGATQNLVAIASQTLATYTVNRYLWGGM
jgi:hypothetical protein